MKIVAINASPRRGWNSDQMLDAFIEGVQAQCPQAEVEKVQLYDMNFKGCRGCLACSLKATENGQCLFKDGATELLRRWARCSMCLPAPRQSWRCFTLCSGL